MKTLKRIMKFSVETERTLIFKTRGDRQVAWCERCSAEVENSRASRPSRMCSDGGKTDRDCDGQW